LSASALARAGWFFAAVVLFVFTFATAARCPGADEADKQEREQKSRRRLEFMQSVIDELEVSSKDIEAASALKPGKTPLLRYSDPTRSLESTAGLLDAGVWRLGESGRPTALITLEIYRGEKAKTILSHEFLSLVPSPLVISSPRGRLWEPTTTSLKMAPLPGAMRPADSPKARMTQLRQMSRRFSVHETLGDGVKVECRLLPQPIDRYSDDDAGISDGALFVFANGTNPELGLLLESSGSEWSYGAVRLSAAALFAELDGKEFFQAPQSFGQPRSSPYIGFGFPIALEE
jgi:hypothetical protein